MEYLTLLICLFILILIWQNNLKSRELAMKYCIKICKKSNLQLLDQTIALKSFSINNWINYLPVISKKYSFEFSINGVDRYNGFIIIIDNRLNLAGLDHPDGSILLHQDEFN